MRVINLRHNFIAVFITSLVLLIPWIASAEGYQVAPVLLDRTFSPGSKETVSITLYNPTDRMVRLYPTVNTVSVDDSGTVTEFASRSQSDDRVTVTSWLAITRGRIQLAANETKEIPLMISVDRQAKPGLYHAFVGFAAGSNRPTAEAEVKAGNAPGTLVRFEIEQDLTSYLQLEQFSTNRFLTNPTAAITSFTLNNPSDTALLPHGEMIIYNNQGQELGSVPLQINKPIAPGEHKEFTLPLPPLEGNIGRHKAVLSVRYGEGQTALLQDTVFFYQLPLIKLIMIFLLILTLALLSAYLIHRRYQVADEDELVAVYHRPKVVRESKDHDIHITSNSKDS